MKYQPNDGNIMAHTSMISGIDKNTLWDFFNSKTKDITLEITNIEQGNFAYKDRFRGLLSDMRELILSYSENYKVEIKPEEITQGIFFHMPEINHIRNFARLTFPLHGTECVIEADMNRRVLVKYLGKEKPLMHISIIERHSAYDLNSTIEKIKHNVPY